MSALYSRMDDGSNIISPFKGFGSESRPNLIRATQSPEMAALEGHFVLAARLAFFDALYEAVHKSEHQQTV